jgi:hypothetical protein
MSAAACAVGGVAPRGKVSARRVWLAWAFTLMNSARVLSYLPTMWAIVQNGDSSQHSLWTWGTWLGANLTMAAWLYESNGDRLNRAAGVCLVNAGMCTTMAAIILWFRW